MTHFQHIGCHVLTPFLIPFFGRHVPTPFSPSLSRHVSARLLVPVKMKEPFQLIRRQPGLPEEPSQEIIG